MKTPICGNSKGNEIIAWCLINIWSCFLLNIHHHYMCCCRRCSLHHICANWVNNDNVHQALEIIYGDKDIHSSSGVAKEKVKNPLLNMCYTFQSNNYDNILKCIAGCCTFILARCHNPTLAKCGGEAQHFQSWGLGVLRDSRMFRVRHQGLKHFALKCSWCHWKGLEA